jgi:transcriptional regulator with XRE-family HTH domain
MVKKKSVKEIYRELRIKNTYNSDKDKYFTVRELAKKMTDDESYSSRISQIENGSAKPSIADMKYYHRYFKVPYEYLLGETINPNYENMTLSNELGLSDEAIQRLKKYNELSQVSYDEMAERNLKQLEFINYLIGKDKLRLLWKIQDYVSSSPAKFDLFPIYEQNVPIKNIDNTRDSLSLEDIESVKLLKIQKTLIELKNKFDEDSKET